MLSKEEICVEQDAENTSSNHSEMVESTYNGI